MKVENYIVLLASVVLCSCGQPDITKDLRSIERCSEAPVAISSAGCFAYEGKGYVIGGRTNSYTPTNHLYCYDPQRDEWSDLGETALKPCIRPRAATVGDQVYMGLGMNGKVLIDSTYIRQWWRWTPATNQWDTMADYPSDRTVGPAVAADERYVYACYGGKQNFERWIFRYDTQTDEWTKMADGLDRMASYPPRANSITGAVCGGRLYIGSGYFRTSEDFWVEAECRDDSVIWHRCTPLNGKRHNAVAATDDRSIYIAGGHYYGGTLTTGMLYDDILRYDPEKDRWTRIGHLPDGGRENMTGWVIDGYLYIGLGNDRNNHPCAELYRIAL